MLSTTRARWLAAPANAVAPVKMAIHRQRGFVSERTCGEGVAEGLRHWLAAVTKPEPL
jgi:hypothetical protein